MNRQFRALQYSLAIHLCLLGGLLLGSRYTTPPLTISLIDFSLAESSGPVAEEPSKSVPKARPAPPPVKKGAARPIERRAEKKVDPKALPPVDSVPEPQSVPVQAEQRPQNPEPEAERALPRTLAEEFPSPMPPAASGEGAAAEAGDSESRPFAARDKYLKEHYTYIRALIMKNLLYPAIAREKGWTGQTRVSFVVCENGCVADIRVVTSSGYRMLDKNVIETIKRASPFPPPPVRAEIVLPITYTLN
ncbi:outer membrane transport energization protein TonB [Desulfuromonas soudanensis]|uniref:Outer membrane transport energization protein TonB n=1 Tax=Desulfuromonas soudanensis TaxID=1603606 RepID=A0A0M3QGJ4_9BACT|nr:energy transducer TonB [Desulfuromonas soudanensis]ALC18089.1 outer membrane transport energization protein TonB [Desulfuromonas soudanensis]